VSSLRDSVMLFPYPGLTSWAKLFRPSGAGAWFLLPGLEPALNNAEGFWPRMFQPSRARALFQHSH
jgi:hypothetical protein